MYKLENGKQNNGKTEKGKRIPDLSATNCLDIIIVDSLPKIATILACQNLFYRKNLFTEEMLLQTTCFS